MVGTLLGSHSPEVEDMVVVTAGMVEAVKAQVVTAAAVTVRVAMVEEGKAEALVAAVPMVDQATLLEDHRPGERICKSPESFHPRKHSSHTHMIQRKPNSLSSR